MKIEIPRNINSLRIDVGASSTAPNTANWIRDTDNCFVIAIEPVLKNVVTSAMLMSYSTNFKNTYFIHAAIDDVKEPEESLMYVTKDIGCSSLYLPQQFEIDHEENITKVNLKYILDKIDWENVNFDYIEYLKTDTQGNDINVLKSMGEYLSKIAVLEIECTTWDEYCDVPNEDEILSFLEENNFKFLKNCEDSLVDGVYVDRLFINKNFLHLKDEIQIDFKKDDRELLVSEVIAGPIGLDGARMLLDYQSFARNYGNQISWFFSNNQQRSNSKINNFYSFKDIDWAGLQHSTWPDAPGRFFLGQMNYHRSLGTPVFPFARASPPPTEVLHEYVEVEDYEEKVK